MIAIDTNVLVRVLVDDPSEPKQMRAARACVKRAGQVLVPQIVQAETVWVLESAYGLDRKDLVDLLGRLLHNQALLLQDEETFQQALGEYRDGSADFADYLILSESRRASCQLATFDKRLKRSDGAVSP